MLAGGDTVAMLYNEGVAALQVGDNQTAKARFVEALELKPELEEAYKRLKKGLKRVRVRGRKFGT